MVMFPGIPDFGAVRVWKRLKRWAEMDNLECVRCGYHTRRLYVEGALIQEKLGGNVERKYLFCPSGSRHKFRVLK